MAYKFGTILVSTWDGNTNDVKFYQVIGITQKSLKLRRVNENVIEQYSNGLYGFCIPKLNDFIEDTIVGKILPKGGVEISPDEIAYCWDGEPVYFSHLW